MGGGSQLAQKGEIALAWCWMKKVAVAVACELQLGPKYEVILEVWYAKKKVDKVRIRR